MGNDMQVSLTINNEEALAEKARSLKIRLLFFVTSLSLVIYITWRMFYTLPFGYGWLSLMLGMVLLLCEIISAFEAFEQYNSMLHTKNPEMPDIPTEWFPDVDVLIMTHNESTDLLFKTVNACVYMTYPDKSKVHIYICDDNNRPAVRELAEKLGVGYLGLSGNKHAKAGNFNNALSKTNSPILATFDADMIPRRHFLMKSVPYFFLPKMKKDDNGRWVKRSESEIDKNYKIGFIQTPQSFYNPDLFQFNLHAETRVPNEQDFFFREVNIGRNHANASIFAGSNAVLSREAMLSVGGMSVNSITEDFETGMKIQQKGYTTYSISTVLAHGLSPSSLDSLLSQRERWARGCIQTIKNVKPFLPGNGLSLAGKISYMSCFLYWWTFARRFFFIVLPVLAILFNIVLLRCSFWQLLAFWLPYYVLHGKTLQIMSGNVRTQYLSNLIDTILFPYMIVPIFLEMIGIRKRKFVVTKKDYEEKRPVNTIAIALPHIVLLASSVIALLACIGGMAQSRSIHSMIIMFWLIVNGKNILLATFFMIGRVNYRKAERFYVSEPVEVEYKEDVYKGLTTDISETGMSIRLDYPVLLPDNEPFRVKVSNEYYSATMNCSVVQVEQLRKGWRYSLRQTDIDEENLREYLQIVFDRKSSFPESIKDPVTLYDDLTMNIGRRLGDDYRSAMRKLPRIPVMQPGTLEDGSQVTMVDFNYKYAWLTPPVDVEGEFSLSLGGHSFELKIAENSPKGNNKQGSLYDVLNTESLLADAAFRDTVYKWVEKR